MTAPARRLGAEDSATRGRLLDAAQELMLEEGYAAVTSRRVAAKAGLKPQLVHYYFRTMDDLFLAVVQRGAEHNLERQAEALASDRPLHALWALNQSEGTRVVVELAALANHRKGLRAQLAAYGEEFRRRQREALTEALAATGLDLDDHPPDALLFLLTALAQNLALEEGIGMSIGHDEIKALVERYLDRFERGT